MQTDLQASDALEIVSTNGKYSARFLKHANGWMAGAIAGKEFVYNEEREAFMADVFDCIEAVSKQQETFSTCTDGRKRLKLEDGSAVPVREQLVGTDTVSAFVAAEALGAHFYGETLYAPVEARIVKVIDHLLAHGYKPTAHMSCGAAGGFTTVINRATQFIKDPAYVARLEQLTNGNYNDTLHHLIVGSYQSRLVSGIYENYRDGLIAEIVLDKVGPTALEYYDDDDRGVHGHREQAIVYLDQSLEGYAINPNALIKKTDGQVFGVNSSRIDALARVMSGDSHQGINYLTARLAIEDFSCAGHGTLASSMETIIVSKTA